MQLYLTIYLIFLSLEFVNFNILKSNSPWNFPQCPVACMSRFCDLIIIITYASRRTSCLFLLRDVKLEQKTAAYFQALINQLLAAATHHPPPPVVMNI